MSRYIIAIMVLLSAAILIDAALENNCPNNQTWTLCGILCQRTCSDPRFRLCDHPCSEATSGCACNDNYVRNENTNLCVLVQDC
ncbi:chymotrypsin inhibitor-like [Colletes latitarsis]|uniref:chymotrypsin inhibitor-like n=1 Tax=Colletes latitarsis TaxID=2605962 RepID=UPI0040351FDF